MKITKIYDSVQSPYELHDEIIKKINEITGKKSPIKIQTKNGKLVKVEVNSTSKKDEIDYYLDSL